MALDLVEFTKSRLRLILGLKLSQPKNRNRKGHMTQKTTVVI